VGLKPIFRTTTSFSALTLLVGSFDPQKPVPEMTYNVFSGTLNPTQSICPQTPVGEFRLRLPDKRHFPDPGSVPAYNIYLLSMK